MKPTQLYVLWSAGAILAAGTAYGRSLERRGSPSPIFPEARVDVFLEPGAQLPSDDEWEILLDNKKVSTGSDATDAIAASPMLYSGAIEPGKHRIAVRKKSEGELKVRTQFLRGYRVAFNYYIDDVAAERITTFEVRPGEKVQFFARLSGKSHKLAAAGRQLEVNSIVRISGKEDLLEYVEDVREPEVIDDNTRVLRNFVRVFQLQASAN